MKAEASVKIQGIQRFTRIGPATSAMGGRVLVENKLTKVLKELLYLQQKQKLQRGFLVLVWFDLSWVGLFI